MLEISRYEMPMRIPGLLVALEEKVMSVLPPPGMRESIELMSLVLALESKGDRGRISPLLEVLVA